MSTRLTAAAVSVSSYFPALPKTPPALRGVKRDCTSMHPPMRGASMSVTVTPRLLKGSTRWRQGRACVACTCRNTWSCDPTTSAPIASATAEAVRPCRRKTSRSRRHLWTPSSAAAISGPNLWRDRLGLSLAKSGEATDGVMADSDDRQRRNQRLALRSSVTALNRRSADNRWLVTVRGVGWILQMTNVACPLK